MKMGFFDSLANMLGLKKKECNVLGKDYHLKIMYMYILDSDMVWHIQLVFIQGSKFVLGGVDL